MRPLAALTVAFCALIAAAVALGVGIRDDHQVAANTQQIRTARAHGAATRTLLANSQQLLCARVYSQLTLIEELAAKQQTLAFYRHVLPDIPVRTVKRLLANAHRQTRLMLVELNPAHCSDLPSQRLTAP